jgi:hypothetical protein
MVIQTTFTVSTGIKLKRQRSVTSTTRAFISVLFVFALGFAGNAGAVVPNQPPEKKIVIVNNSAKRVFFSDAAEGGYHREPRFVDASDFCTIRKFSELRAKKSVPAFWNKARFSRVYRYHK